MAETLVSIDEFLSAREGFVKSGDVIVKASGNAARSWDPKTRSIRFVMSAEVEDRDRDIVVQAGMDLTEFLKNPVAPLQHRAGTFPVGTWTDVEKILNGRPKRHEGTLVVMPEGEDPDADRLARHFNAGTIKASSIGFLPKTVVKRDIPDDKKDKAGYWPGYEVRECELIECSPVLIPANPAAMAKMAKDGEVIGQYILEQVLDNWAKHPETGLIIPRAEFESAYKTIKSGETTTITIKVPDVEGFKQHQEATYSYNGVPPVDKAHDPNVVTMAVTDGEKVEITPEPQPKGILAGIAKLLAKAFPDHAELVQDRVEREEAERQAEARKARLAEVQSRLQATEERLSSKGLV